MEHVVKLCMFVPRHLQMLNTSLVSKDIADGTHSVEWPFLRKFFEQNPHYEHYREETERKLFQVGEPRNPQNILREAPGLVDGIMRMRVAYRMYFNDVLSLFQLGALVREMFIFTFPIHRDIILVRELGRRKLNQKRARTLRRKCQSTTAREIVNFYYNQTIRRNSSDLFWAIKGCLRYTADCTLWDNRLIELYDDATKPFVIKPDHKTSTVISIAQGMKWNEDWSPGPILADALQDAGYENTEELDRLRGDGVKSQASSLFRELGL